MEKSQLSSPQAKAILQVMEVELSAQHELLATKADLGAVASDLRIEILATKTELTAVASDLRAEILASRAELNLRIEASRVDSLRWLIASTGVMLGAFYFFLNYARK